MRAPDAEDGSHTALRAWAGVASTRDACLIDVAPAAGTIDPAVHGFPAVPTIAERLTTGAELVIVDGAGLLGGPACGIIVGRRRLVELAANHQLATLAAADALTAAVLKTTIELYHDAEKGPVILQVPVWQQLSAPLDNLKQRAERLAPLMTESDAVASAECRQFDSPWRRWGDRQWMAPTSAIVLRPVADDCRALRAQLQRSAYPVLARECDGEMYLDLRTVFPRWDQQLVAAVAGQSG
jgi:L-seryl-tRNA(Ser) seleniumtransferase